MEELIAKTYLTQVADVPIKERIFVKKILTANPEMFREATKQEISDKEEYDNQQREKYAIPTQVAEESENEEK